MTRDKEVYAEVTVKFKIDNLGTKNELEEVSIPNTCEEIVQWLIDEEGLWGIVDDEYKIIKIEIKEKDN